MQSQDAMLLFQIVDLGRQYYVWMSAVGPKLGNLHLAIQTPMDKVPAVTSLLPGAPPSGEAPAVAQRLALKLGKPVVVSCNLPPNAPLLQAVAERRLLAELQAMAAEAQAEAQAAAAGGGEGAPAAAGHGAQGAAGAAGAAAGSAAAAEVAA